MDEDGEGLQGSVTWEEHCSSVQSCRDGTREAETDGTELGEGQDIPTYRRGPVGALVSRDRQGRAYPLW